MMQMMRLLLMGLALMLAVAACQADRGSGDGRDGARESPTPTELDEDGLERIAEAAEHTVGQGTARFTLRVETDEDTGAAGSLEAEGEEDFAAERRRLILQGPRGELEMIVDGSQLYLQLPATEAEQWARVDLDEFADGDIGFGGPGGVPFQDSRNNLEVLQEATGQVRELGEEDVRSEDTTHYELTIDLGDAAQQTEDDAGEALRRLSERTGLEELDMQVWVDDDDLIRRIAYTVDVSEVEVDEDAEADVEADPQGAVTVTVEYVEFGSELDIELPDDDAVVDFDEQQLREGVSEGASLSGT